jgi:hypothetical protein
VVAAGVVVVVLAVVVVSLVNGAAGKDTHRGGVGQEE